MLDDGRDFGRYLDVDGDGIPFRTYPGTHPTKGSFFTRGTSRDRYARYTEEGAAYQDNMQRLLRKFETAKDLVPRPLQANAQKPTKYGVIYFGSTAPAMDEAIGMLEARGHQLDRLRIRAFPFHSSVASFIADHDFVYVVEQNRDAQLRSMIVNENGIDPVRLVPILHLRRHPDHRALHRQGDRRPSGPAQSHSAPEECVMTYIAKPKFQHPGLPKNDLGYTHRDYEGKVSTCAPAAAMTRSPHPSSRPASSFRSSRTGWRKFPASAARRRRRTISSAIRTASTRCTAACRRC
jgi:hypothetical protein